jgi:ribosomal protein S12 methylthiotransferase
MLANSQNQTPFFLFLHFVQNLKTKGHKQLKVNIITLGCAKNLVDSEILITQLKNSRINVQHESQDMNPDVVIINTCGFIDNAKKESVDTILHYADARARGDLTKLYVTGCLSERYKKELEQEIPQVDAFFGTKELPALLKRFGTDYQHELVGERLTTTAPHYAYMKISEGCDRPCAFCAIPIMRGRHISRPLEELINEARYMARKGVKELLLIAQDSTYYGLDIYNSRRLADLLKYLSDIESIEWIRLHYAFPSGFPMDVLDVIRERPNICNYIDIPLQHASSKILKLMKRGINREGSEKLIHKIREKVPGIAIRTTMMVGHPGETAKDFDELLEFIDSIRFERLGVFTYSHEEGTASYLLQDSISKAEKKKRAGQVMHLQEEISQEINLSYLNKNMKVIIDRKENNCYIGRTEFDSPEVDNEVIVDATNSYFRIGEFANIHITDALPFDLIGEPLIPTTD